MALTAFPLFHSSGKGPEKTKRPFFLWVSERGGSATEICVLPARTSKMTEPRPKTPMASRIAFGKTMRPTSSIETVAFIGNQYANSQIFCQWKVGRGNLRPETGDRKPEKVWSESEEWNLELETGDWKKVMTAGPMVNPALSHSLSSFRFPISGFSPPLTLPSPFE
jgi:hypothetical protein